MEDDLDFNEVIPKSGLICTKCGYDDSLQCEIDGEPSDILCGTHAAEDGYCCCCGQFWAGTTEFDFQHPGYCPNCYDEIRSGEHDDDDDDWYDNEYFDFEYL